MNDEQKVNGSCLCGQVNFDLIGELRSVVYCHCQQCRKTSGHFVAATVVMNEDLKMVTDAGLAWYRSSDKAERGFCKECGSSIFWRPDNDNYIGVMAGALESPTGIEACEHIYTDDAGDYYSIDDGLPKYPQDDDDLHDKWNV